MTSPINEKRPMHDRAFSAAIRNDQEPLAPRMNNIPTPGVTKLGGASLFDSMLFPNDPAYRYRLRLQRDIDADATECFTNSDIKLTSTISVKELNLAVSRSLESACSAAFPVVASFALGVSLTKAWRLGRKCHVIFDISEDTFRNRREEFSTVLHLWCAHVNYLSYAPESPMVPIPFAEFEQAARYFARKMLEYRDRKKDAVFTGPFLGLD
ncbi:hypothetical protein [Caballeronia sp. GAWG1-1]|uniref:hypothetical protein n=1 Tax=Caballeronia sp. GAWG1-1 TaxID=2921742 RepID=UPI0020287FE3|nr:hypothetical protein [Caballeronia sp. GAWG1-1]